MRLSTREELPCLLNELGLVGVGAEIGVFRGDFAETILNGWDGKTLLLIDSWKHLDDYFDSWNLSDSECEKNLKQVEQRMAKFGNRAQVVRATSECAALRVLDGSLDFVYIDANHGFEATRRDLLTWFPKVRVGGLVAGHDYFDALAGTDLEPDRDAIFDKDDPSILTSYGVQSAVDEFAFSNGYNVMTTMEEFPTWYFLK